MSELFQLILHGESNAALGKLTPETLNQQLDGSSLLMYALQHQQDDIALKLIELGIDVNLQNNQGQTALHLWLFIKMISVLLAQSSHMAQTCHCKIIQEIFRFGLLFLMLNNTMIWSNYY